MKRALPKTGLTLFELILVMAILATVLAVSGPALGKFFAGRNTVQESRRVYALVRYSRTVAIERSTMTEFWVEPASGKYGMTTQVSTGQPTDKPVEWELNEKLHFEIGEAPLDDQQRLVIRFWPDGTIDEQAPQMIGVREQSGQGLDITKRVDGFGYDLGEVGDGDDTQQG